MAKLQEQTMMPLSMRQQLHMPPMSAEHMCCTMLQATASPQEQVIFMPPLHFSIFMVQRGTISELPGIPGVTAGMPIPIGVEAIPGSAPIRPIIDALLAIG
jgi:hypothetical protein